MRWKDSNDPLSVNGRATQAFNFFVSKGYSEAQAAGLVGNLSVETGNFDEEVIKGERRGDGGKAVGIAQWHPDRQAKFKEAYGIDLKGSSFEQQLEYIDYELKNHESRAASKLSSVDNYKTAAEVVDIYYERSSGEHRQKRIDEAERIFSQLVQSDPIPKTSEYTTKIDTVDDFYPDFSFEPIINPTLQQSETLEQDLQLLVKTQQEETTKQNQVDDIVEQDKDKKTLQSKINKEKFLQEVIQLSTVKNVDRVLRQPSQSQPTPTQFEDGGTYTVQKGDTLSELSNRFNTSIGQIANNNNISNVNNIKEGQTLLIQGSQKQLNKQVGDFNTVFKENRVKHGPNHVFTYEDKQYTTNIAGEPYEPKKGKLTEHLKQENRKVTSPFSGKEFVSLEKPYWTEWSKTKEVVNEVNKMTDAEKIINFHSGKDDTYFIVDKKNARMHLYENKNKTASYEILTGENTGDSQTDTSYIDRDKDGKITEADRPFKLDTTQGNKTTGAGIYTIGRKNQSSEYRGLPSFNLRNEQGVIVPTTIHGTPSSRLQYFNDGDVTNNRQSYGCINGKCNDLREIYSNKSVGEGTKVYILPEDVNNGFLIESGELKFYSDNKNANRTLSGDFSKDKVVKYQQELYDKGYLKEKKDIDGIWGKMTQTAYDKAKQNGVDPILTGKEASIPNTAMRLTNEFYTKQADRFDIDNKKELENTVKPFVKSLQENKALVMKTTGVSNDEYNEIATLAFGIFGNETSFGDTNNIFENGLKAIGKTINPKSTSPDYKSKYGLYGAKNDSNSVGLTQFRWKWVQKDTEQGGNLEQMLNEVGVSSNKDFMDPTKAALATTTVLSYYYKTRKMTQQDIMNGLAGHWGGNTNNKGVYIQNAKNNATYLQIFEKDKK